MKAPISIRIIYWIMNIILGLLAITFVAALFFYILHLFGFLGGDFQLRTRFPVEVSFMDVGELVYNGKTVKVELVDAVSQIHFINTPRKLVTIFIGMMLFVLLYTFYMSWTFRSFINNVRKGIVFTMKNISYLKRIAYLLAGFWVFMIVYLRILYYTIGKEVLFDNVIISNQHPNYGGVLLAALFIWTLAHIFMTGLKLQQDQDLTI